MKTEAKTKCHRPTVERSSYPSYHHNIIQRSKKTVKEKEKEKRKMKKSANSNDQKLENPLSVKLKQAP